MVVYRTLPSFTLAISQLIEASEAEGFERGSSTSPSAARAASPSSEHVDLMKTIDCRTDSEDIYDNNDDDDDYWNFKHQASSDYEAYCNGYYDDDTDNQTLFDEPMPLSYGMNLTRQSRRHHHHSTRSSSRSGSSGTAVSSRESSSDESSPRPNPLRNGVPLAWKTMVRRITTRTKGFASTPTSA